MNRADADQLVTKVQADPRVWSATPRLPTGGDDDGNRWQVYVQFQDGLGAPGLSHILSLPEDWEYLIAKLPPLPAPFLETQRELPPAQQWEYRATLILADVSGMAELNAYGANGWEIIGAASFGNDGWRLLLKRTQH